MWKFKPCPNKWALTDQNSTSDGGLGVGSYGMLGQASPANLPGERASAASWKDSNGDLWLFGGDGLANAFPVGGLFSVLNDLWEFNPSQNQWIWRGGSNTDVCLTKSSAICVNSGQLGTYGTLGMPASQNVPGGRAAAATWVDRNGNFWLLGGFGFDANGTYGYLNDMWEYNLNSSVTGASPSPITATPTLSLAAGSYSSSQTLTVSDQKPNAVIDYTTDGSAPNSSSAVHTGTLTVPSSETVEAIAVAPKSAASGVAIAAFTLTIPQAATPAFSVPGGTYTAAQTIAITDTTPAFTIYYTLDGTNPTPASPVYSSPLTISSTATLKSIAVASGYATALSLPPATQSFPRQPLRGRHLLRLLPSAPVLRQSLRLPSPHRAASTPP